MGRGVAGSTADRPGAACADEQRQDSGGSGSAGGAEADGCCGGSGCADARAGGATSTSGQQLTPANLLGSSSGVGLRPGSSGSGGRAPSGRAPSEAGGGAWGNRRATLCVSSQVGCQMGCTFCATGERPLLPVRGWTPGMQVDRFA